MAAAGRGSPSVAPEVLETEIEDGVHGAKVVVVPAGLGRGAVGRGRCRGAGDVLGDGARAAQARAWMSLASFGGVGDGRTLNTDAFAAAVARLERRRARGGALLYVPPGVWLSGPFSLTSHLTLFLARGAVIRATQDTSSWPLIEPLPSYGRGRELPGKRYMSLIHGNGLQDVFITGTISPTHERPPTRSPFRGKYDDCAKVDPDPYLDDKAFIEKFHNDWVDIFHCRVRFVVACLGWPLSCVP